MRFVRPRADHDAEYVSGGTSVSARVPCIAMPLSPRNEQLAAVVAGTQERNKKACSQDNGRSLESAERGDAQMEAGEAGRAGLIGAGPGNREQEADWTETGSIWAVIRDNIRPDRGGILFIYCIFLRHYSVADGGTRRGKWD